MHLIQFSANVGNKLRMSRRFSVSSCQEQLSTSYEMVSSPNLGRNYLNDRGVFFSSALGAITSTAIFQVVSVFKISRFSLFLFYL